MVHHLARVVVGIFREHTVRSVTNPPSLPHCLTVNSDAVCLDAYYPLTVKRAPSAFALGSCNGEITATNDAGCFESVASAFDLLGVPGIELQGTDGPVQLLELYRDDAAASVLDKALDKGSLVGNNEGVHGEKKKRGSRLVEGTIV